MIEATMKEKVKEFIVKNFKWIILFICLIGFLAIAENVFNKEIMNGDIVGYKLILPDTVYKPQRPSTSVKNGRHSGKSTMEKVSGNT